MAIIQPINAHWRDSARPVRFFMWDAKTAFPLVLFLIHMKLWTLFLSLGVMCFFTILNYYGFSIEVFGRSFRTILAGPRKMVEAWWLS